MSFRDSKGNAAGQKQTKNGTRYTPQSEDICFIMAIGNEVQGALMDGSLDRANEGAAARNGGGDDMTMAKYNGQDF